MLDVTSSRSIGHSGLRNLSLTPDFTSASIPEFESGNSFSSSAISPSLTPLCPDLFTFVSLFLSS